jgi:alkaline phosphatase D
VTDNWDASTDAKLVRTALLAWDMHFPRRDMDRVYRSWRWGPAEFILLDTRRYRSANDAPADGTKTMLGEEQLAWLLNAIKSSSARWLVLLSSVPLDFVQSVDTWESFVSERNQVRDALDPTRAIVISGDQHYFAKQVHSSGLREYICGPLTAGIGSIPEPVPSEVEVLVPRRNFLLLEISDPGNPSLRITAIADDGDVIFQETLSA